MKSKLLFGLVACTAMVVAISLNVNSYTKGSDLSGIALANIEALANSEGGQLAVMARRVWLAEVNTLSVYAKTIGVVRIQLDVTRDN
jgi:hypothetical protein